MCSGKVLVSNIADTINPAGNSIVSTADAGVAVWSDVGAMIDATIRRMRRGGAYNSADFGVADGNIGSSASFLRFYYQNSTYHPMKRRFSFARSIRFGGVVPYGDTISLTFPPPTTLPLPTLIPLPERFFAGGGTSLRGFAIESGGAARRDDGISGGRAGVAGVEPGIRFPMRLPYFGTSLGGAIFYDAGNVFSRLSRISFRSSLPQSDVRYQ